VKERILHLSGELAAQVLSAAARTHPLECCGLIEGTNTDDGWRALTVHETANVAEDASRHFLIDPQAQFDLLRTLRGSSRRIIGCFHSHPDSGPEPSATDRANAEEFDFLWLIAGGSPNIEFTLRGYHFLKGTGFCPIVLRDD
jgi:proteasome lid subunit RPN8/RPN11